MNPKTNLNELIKGKIETLGDDEASKFFGVGTARLRKMIAGTPHATVFDAQKILDELIDKGVLVIADEPKERASGASDAADRVAQLKAAANEQEERLKTMLEDAREEIESLKSATAILAATPDEKDKIIAELTAQMAGFGKTSEEPQVEMKPSKVAILVPANRDLNLEVVKSMLGQWKSTLPESVRQKLALFFGEKDTMIHQARNRLADNFLKSDKEWSFWMDTDIIAPIGNGGWFRKKTGSKFGDEFAAQEAVRRLCSHGKSIVAATVLTRDGSKRSLSHVGLHPNGDKEIAEQIKLGPVNKIVQIPWSGFGCVVVHRQVFEDIKKACPEIAPKTEGEMWGFFNPVEGPNNYLTQEDVAFQMRASKAGHHTWLDLGLRCGHLMTSVAI